MPPSLYGASGETRTMWFLFTVPPAVFFFAKAESGLQISLNSDLLLTFPQMGGESTARASELPSLQGTD